MSDAMSRVSEEREIVGEIDDGVNADLSIGPGSEQNSEDSQDAETQQREEIPMEYRMENPRGSLNLKIVRCGNVKRVEDAKVAKVNLKPHLLRALHQLHQGETGTRYGGILVCEDKADEKLIILSLISSTLKKKASKSSDRESMRYENGTLIITSHKDYMSWEKMINYTRHKEQKHFSVEFFSGRAKKKHTKNYWAAQGAVLTNYGSFVKDKQCGKRSILQKIHWKRVIVDTANVVKNGKIPGLTAIRQLTVSYSWMLTDTPIVNGNLDASTLWEYFDRSPIENMGGQQSWGDMNNAQSGNQTYVTDLESLQVIVSRNNQEESCGGSGNYQQGAVDTVSIPQGQQLSAPRVNGNSFGTPKRNLKRKADPGPSASDDATARPPSALQTGPSYTLNNTTAGPAVTFQTMVSNTGSGSRVDQYILLDIGNFIRQGTTMPDDMKNHVLKNAWVPPKDYDFAADARDSESEFDYRWLEKYSPWLAYSGILKGALCKYCVLFPQSDGMMSDTGAQSFVTVAFHHHNNSQNGYKLHERTSGHQAAERSAKLLEGFREGPHHRRQSLLQRPTDQRNKALSAVVSCLIFCGTHDLPLQDDNLDESALMHSYQLRVEAGDSHLKRHLENGLNNLLYRSSIVHKEIIDLCGNVIREQILMRVKEAPAYSILADETAKIAGKDHLAIGLRFFDEQANEVVEEFLGFAEPKKLDAPSIAEAIFEFVTIKLNLDSDRCVGLGFDGCSATLGKEKHVLALLNQKYEKALYFHCSWRKLHLVANELSHVPSIRSCIGALADISLSGDINDVPKFHESEWWTNVEDYVVATVDHLPGLCANGDLTTRIRAYELDNSKTFVETMLLIGHYTSLLVRVANILQSKPLDIVNTNNRIQIILGKLRSDLQDAGNVTTAVQREADLIAERSEIQSSGTCDADQRRSQVDGLKCSLTIPYLKSIISFLEVRFSANHWRAFSLTYFHPSNMRGVSFAEWNKIISPCETFYDLQIELTEKQLWFEEWKNVREVPNIIEFLNKNESFYPSIRDALLIMLSQPYASTVERSFSTLRRIETWRRNTVDANRSSGLAMLSIHREWVIRNKEQLVKHVVEKFATYHHADLYSEN